MTQTFCIFAAIEKKEKTLMSNPYFKFKQFVVWHDKCGMKVGTDGVLLGCLAGKDADLSLFPTFSKALDIGTGTGLIALMLAQRFPKTKIIAIDIDPNAVIQAKENIAASIFSNRIDILEMDFTSSYNILNESVGQFDLIVSNPPFYEEDTFSANFQTNIAKHSQSLPFSELLEGTASLLSDDGLFCVILPYSSALSFISEAVQYQLFLYDRYNIKNSIAKDFKRSVLTFSKKCLSTNIHTLMLRNSKNEYSEQYKELTKDFYL